MLLLHNSKLTCVSLIQLGKDRGYQLIAIRYQRFLCRLAHCILCTVVIKTLNHLHLLLSLICQKVPHSLHVLEATIISFKFGGGSSYRFSLDSALQPFPQRAFFFLAVAGQCTDILSCPERCCQCVAGNPLCG